jgi:hypothetical protein
MGYITQISMSTWRWVLCKGREYQNESRCLVGTKKPHGLVFAVVGRCCWFWCCCVGVFEPFFCLER